ncbi:MAG: transporter substrate-binding domain-containing protein [Caldilineaceae bacterium]
MSACTGGNLVPTAATPEATTEPTTAPAVATAVPTEASAGAGGASASAADMLLARVGINAQFEPFVYKDEAGQVVGFDLDLMTALTKAGNFEVTYMDLPFEELLAQVASGELDAAISAITVTAERAEQVNFSDVYFESGSAPVSYYNPGQGLAVRLDETTILSADNLTAQVKVGVKADTTGAYFVATETDAQVVAYPEAANAFAALRNGDVDAVVIDIPVIVRYISNNADAGIRITGGPLTDEQYAIAVSPARADLLARINSALAQLRADGTYDQIFEKWFGSP